MILKIAFLKLEIFSYVKKVMDPCFIIFEFGKPTRDAIINQRSLSERSSSLISAFVTLKANKS